MTAVRMFEVELYGYETIQVCARTPAKARARAYAMFMESRSVKSDSFHWFLVNSKIRSIPSPERVGERILVNGLPATRAWARGHEHYVPFMRDDEDVIRFAHPGDVEYLPAQTPLGP